MNKQPANTNQPPRQKRSGSEKRRRQPRIIFRVSVEERAEMQANAAAVGLSIGSYLRSLAVASPRTRIVRRPIPELTPFLQAYGKFGIHCSNAYQLLRKANRGEIPCADELAETCKKLNEAADELLKVIRG
jgi:hypothetical protein